LKAPGSYLQSGSVSHRGISEESSRKTLSADSQETQKDHIPIVSPQIALRRARDTTCCCNDDAKNDEADDSDNLND
jgi:hypothetical protein